MAKNQKYDRYQSRLESVVYIFFDKNSLGNGVKSEITLNQELAEELHKSFTRKFEKRKDYSSFKGNIWGIDLVDIQFIYALLIIIVNMLRLVLGKTKKVLQLLMLFEKY